MPNYSIILFDADNTLFDFHRAEKEALLEALAAMGVGAVPEMLDAYSQINDGFWKMLERGEISKKELRVARFAAFFEKYAIRADVECMARTYTDKLATKCYLMPEAFEVCEELAKHCAMYITTNGISSVQRGRFEPSPLRPFFQDIFISEELGFEKPRVEYFRAVADTIPHFAPERTLVVGDSLTSDIQGAISAGLDNCWYNPAGKQAPDGFAVTYTVSRLKEILPLVLSD